LTTAAARHLKNRENKENMSWILISIPFREKYTHTHIYRKRDKESQQEIGENVK